MNKKVDENDLFIKNKEDNKSLSVNTDNLSKIEGKYEPSDKFEFKTVEEFFEDDGQIQTYRDWSTLGFVLGCNQPTDNSIELKFETDESTPCAILISFPTPTVFRLRFHPLAENAEFYPKANSRSIVMDSEQQLCSSFSSPALEIEETGIDFTVFVKDSATNIATMKLVIKKNPYQLSVYKFDGSDYILAHQDAFNSIYYRKRVKYSDDLGEKLEYSIIQAKEMPEKAKYIGFGEKGGENFIRNGSRLTYFNFDNMRYRQIYNNGPKDIREPLYDSNPFFLETNRYDDKKVVYGIFVDNLSETFFDLGSYNYNREYLFGSIYGDLDYYFYLGEDTQDVLKQYYNFVGKTRLKPRHSLGNQQGCYGYMNKYDLEDVTNGYRGNSIPLDGLHVDVDVQFNHCTFTMNEDSFPADTFDTLAGRGIKCSTNITPVVSYVNFDYKTFESGAKNGLFISADQINGGSSNSEASEIFYQGGVYYGGERGTFGHYPDFARKEVRQWWGQQYRLLYSRGLEMVWQDMTTPAIPDPSEQENTYIYAPCADDYWRIPDKITGDSRSLPFEQLVSDNSLKKYEGESSKAKQRLAKGDRAPAASIRNLYSYNLHKATYHGLNTLWLINPYSFTTVGENGITVEESQNIINALVKDKKLELIDASHQLYKVLTPSKAKLALPKSLKQYEAEVQAILEQSLTIEARRANKRNFIVGRGGFTGMHRFAALWTGDNASEWDFLQINISQVLALGMAGQSMSGQDIGGFEPANGTAQEWADPELFSRWIGAGAFLPWFRNHYSRKGTKKFQEPYKFQDVIDQVSPSEKYLYEAVLPISQYYVQLRYRLMQVFYDGLFKNTLDGLPIVKPLIVSDGHDNALYNDKAGYLNNEFMVGDSLLIAPVLKKENTGANGYRDIYVPSGSRWYSFKNNTQPLSAAVEGGTEIIGYNAQISASPDKVPFVVPIYVREGAILPTIELEQYVGELNKSHQMNPVTLNIYPGKETEYIMFNDDGESRSSAPKGLVEQGADPLTNSEFRKTRIHHHFVNDKQRDISLAWLHNNYAPLEDHYYVAIQDDPDYPTEPLSSIKLVSANISPSVDEHIEFINVGSDEANAEALANSQTNAWYYNHSIRTSFVKVFFDPSLQTLTPVASDVHQDAYSLADAPNYTLQVTYK